MSGKYMHPRSTDFTADNVPDEDVIFVVMFSETSWAHCERFHGQRIQPSNQDNDYRPYVLLSGRGGG